MKKRLSALTLSLMLLLSLVACGEQEVHVQSIQGYYGTSSEQSVPTAQEPDGQGPDTSQGNLPDDNQGPDNVNRDNPPDDDQGLSGGGEGNVNQAGEKGDDGNRSVDEDGWYTSKEEVALYIHLYGELPDNYVTKKEAEEAGWSGGNVERYTGEGTAIGGSTFGNREGLLPKERGRTYTECDIDTPGENSRGAKRIVYSNDGLVYYTEDHYESFELLYGEP